MRLTRKILVGLLIAAGCSVVLVMLALAYIFNANPVSDSKLNRLRIGMKTNQVTEVLGPPSRWFPEQRNYEYSSQFLMHTVYIRFDEQLHYVGYYLD